MRRTSSPNPENNHFFSFTVHLSHSVTGYEIVINGSNQSFSSVLWISYLLDKIASYNGLIGVVSFGIAITRSRTLENGGLPIVPSGIYIALHSTGQRLLRPSDLVWYRESMHILFPDRTWGPLPYPSSSYILIIGRVGMFFVWLWTLGIKPSIYL